MLQKLSGNVTYVWRQLKNPSSRSAVICTAGRAFTSTFSFHSHIKIFFQDGRSTSSLSSTRAVLSNICPSHSLNRWLIMYPMHRNCPVCNKDIVEELLIPLYGNESDWQPSRKENGGGVGVGVGVGGVGRSGSGGGNVDDNGSGKEMDARKIPSRPQGVHLPPNPNTTNSLAQASPTDAGDLMRVADAYPQQNNRRFGSSVPGVAFQFGFRLLVTGESPGYAQQQALLSWMLLLLGSFVVFCLLVF